jgi:uncharacterized membrane protein (UPF0136 family)
VTAPLPPIGFWSYARADDRNSAGQVSRLRDKVASEIEILMGPRPPVELWQDTSDIPGGSVWRQQIGDAIGRASFFIAVITPGFLHSKWCCEEVLRFREREAALGRNDMIFPFVFANTDDLDPDREGDCHDAAAFRLLRERQETRFYDLRYHDFDNWQVRARIGEFATNIRGALRRPAAAPGALPGASFGPSAATPAAAPLDQREVETANRQVEEDQYRETALATARLSDPIQPPDVVVPSISDMNVSEPATEGTRGSAAEPRQPGSGETHGAAKQWRAFLTGPSALKIVRAVGWVAWGLFASVSLVGLFVISHELLSLNITDQARQSDMFGGCPFFFLNVLAFVSGIIRKFRGGSVVLRGIVSFVAIIAWLSVLHDVTSVEQHMETGVKILIAMVATANVLGVLFLAWIKTRSPIPRPSVARVGPAAQPSFPADDQRTDAI